MLLLAIQLGCQKTTAKLLVMPTRFGIRVGIIVPTLLGFGLLRSLIIAAAAMSFSPRRLD